jgi:hypothetical protein
MAAGIGILLTVAVALLIVELAEEGTTNREAPNGDLDCDLDGCGTDFTDNFDVGTIDGAPTTVNAIFAFVMGLALAAGFLLVGTGLLSTFTGGGG